ncbi:hypothetical protein [Pseudalkalibacillus berkeleyi]|uniref:Regulatory protein YycH domain-containing protein n=1 Tax=Pseudalkalibacillus berkeleyi TaxID=1069813 RepID=A0ABS9H0I6_9BACL|nr:hypothetical protein [Pseudalkalibacillus berkeleyi]MCF6137273.1 hypothetical protein [Pseudalkalibacillus berkeleyi]
MIAFIILGNQFQQRVVQSIEVNEDNFDVVDSYEKVKLYSRLGPASRGDLLKTAYDHNLIHSFEEKEVKVLGSNRTIQIHQVWNQSLNIYVLYSVNLLPEDEKPVDVPYVTLDQVILHNDSNQDTRLKVDVNKLDPYLNQGFVFNNRLYRSTWIKTSLDDDSHSSRTKIFKDTKQVSLENLQLVTKESAEAANIDRLTLNMELTDLDEPLEVYPLNKEIQLTSQTTVMLKRVEVGLTRNKLYISLGENKEQMRELVYYINDQGERGKIQTDDEGEQFLYVRDHIVNQPSMKVQFTEATLPIDDELKYHLNDETMKDYKQFLKNDQNSSQYELNEEIGTSKNDESYTIENLDVSRLENGSEAVSLNMKVSGDSHVLLPNWMIDYSKYLKLDQDDPYKTLYQSLVFLEVTNSQGEKVDILNINGYRNMQGLMGVIQIEKDVFQQQDELTFRFFNFSEQIPLYSESVEITLDK